MRNAGGRGFLRQPVATNDRVQRRDGPLVRDLDLDLDAGLRGNASQATDVARACKQQALDKYRFRRAQASGYRVAPSFQSVQPDGLKLLGHSHVASIIIGKTGENRTAYLPEPVLVAFAKVPTSRNPDDLGFKYSGRGSVTRSTQRERDTDLGTLNRSEEFR